MKNTIVVIVGLFLLSGCGQKQEAENASRQPAREWREHGFAVDFTGEPTYSSSPQQSPYGVYPMHTYQYKVRTGLAFQITMEELPIQFGARNPTGVLDRAVQSLSQLLRGDMLNENATSQGNYPAKDFEIDAPPSLIKGRFILVNNRLFRVSAFVTKSSEAESASEVDAFMKSFKILQ